MPKFDDEPSMEDIEDFDGKESQEKSNTIRLVIVLILIVGAIYTYFKYANDTVDDYVGTPEKPGIDVTKGR